MDPHAICCALASAHVAIGTTAPTRWGNMIAHSRTCMPPIEPPTTACQRAMPSESASSACARTMSRIVTTGNRSAYGLPSDGSGDAGPVVPWQPPSTFAHTTKYLSVSIGLPGPMSPSHQPGVGWPGPAGPAA